MGQIRNKNLNHPSVRNFDNGRLMRLYCFFSIKYKLISTRVIKNLFNNFENIKKEWVELKKTGDAF